MNQFITDTRVVNGHLTLDNIPFAEEMEVKVVVIPKAILNKMAFQKVQKLTKSIKGNMADDIIAERNS